MKPRTPQFSDAHALIEPTAAALHSISDEIEAFMGLISQCVDAMHIMQERMAGLEDQIRRKDEATTLDRSEAKAELMSLRARLLLTESTIDQMTTRLSAAEASTLESMAVQAREDLAAREMAESWREHAETQAERLDDVENRLVSVEDGLERRLGDAEVRIGDAEVRLEAASSAAADLQLLAEASEVAAAESARKLHDAGNAIAEQRTRIATLRSKLALINGFRPEHDVNAAPPDAPATLDIMDLSDHAIPGRRVSAA